MDLFPRPKKPLVEYGRVSSISSGVVQLGNYAGGTSAAASTQAGYMHAGSSLLVIRPGGDSQTPIAIGMSGYQVP